jgi:hypothetical protein
MTCKITNHRSGEIKFGENDNDTKGEMLCLLQNSEAKYVIVGIPRHRDKS